MIRKTILFGIFLAMLASSVNAQTQEELAEQYYNLASDAFNKNDCKNASIYVNRAFDLYAQIGSVVGKTKCEDLILKINNCLGPAGDTLYIQALDYFTNGVDYLNSGNYKEARKEFDTAMVLIYNANSSYHHMLPPDPERLKKIDIKYQQISDKIWESELKKADDLYASALDFFSREDVFTARLYVDNASEIYTMYNHLSGMDKSRKLLDEILKWISTKKERADYLYEGGIGDYTGANCTNKGFFDALDKFKEAKDTYILVQDFTGAQNCEYMTNQTNKRIGGCRDVLLETANEYYIEANTLYILANTPEDCDRAEEIANTVKRMYTEVYNMFKDTISSAGMIKCDQLIKNIKAKKIGITGIIKARESHNSAVRLFNEGEYEQAYVLVKEARGIFEGMGDFGGVTDCDRLIKDISLMLDKIKEAEGYYNVSLGYYMIAEYENATVYVLKAREIYTNMSRIKSIEACNKTLKDIDKGVKLRKEADIYYAEALRYLEYREYGTARDNAELARDLYKKINHAGGLDKAQKLIDRIPEPSPPLDLTIIISLILVTTLFVILFWSREKVKRSRDKTEAERRVKEEEEGKRKGVMEAERVRREREKEKMVLERRRLKEILEKEKKVIGKETTKDIPQRVDDRIKPRDVSKGDAGMADDKMGFDSVKLEDILKKYAGAVDHETKSDIDNKGDAGAADDKIKFDKAKFEDMLEQEMKLIRKDKKSIEGNTKEE